MADSPAICMGTDMNIYLIRHGRQSSNLCNVNVDLHSIGKIQADLLGKRLQMYSIDGLYSSHLIRAVQTAEILNQYLGLEHIIREELKELSFGQMEGMSDEAIMKQFKDFKEEQDTLSVDIPYPEGENGEDGCRRAFPVLCEIAKSGKQNVVIVTHGGLIRALITKILSMENGKRLLLAPSLENCSITQLIYNEKKDRFYLQRFNDYAHMEQDEKLLRKSR